MTGHIKHLEDCIPMVFSVFFVYMWLATFDMGYMIAPFTCLISGLAIYDVIKFFLQRQVTVTNPFYKNLYMVAPVLLLFISFVKPLVFMSAKYPYVINSSQAKTSIYYSTAWKDGMDWLRKNTPALSYPTDEIVKKNEFKPDSSSTHYGILTAWDYGNIVNQRGHRIPSWSRWPGRRITQEYYQPYDSVDLTGLCKNCEGIERYDYFVVNDKMAGSFFLSKINANKIDLSDCYRRKTLRGNGNTVNVVELGDCYENNFVVKAYMQDSVDQKLELVWESNQESYVGQFFNGSSVGLRELPLDRINPQQLQAIEMVDWVYMNDGVFFNFYRGPEVRIYRIKHD